MKVHHFPRPAASIALSLLGFAGLAQNVFAQEHWIETWAASPQARAGGPPRAAQPGAPATPATKNPAQPTSFNDQTVRMIVHTSIGGSRARVELSNAYGTAPLMIGRAHIGIHVSGGMVRPGTDKTLTFGGKLSISIPPGALAVSDPVSIAVPKLGDLAVSLYFPKDTGPLTMHSTGLHTTYIMAGDVSGVTALGEAPTTHSWYFLSSVDVAAPAATGIIVAFGDSITDGATSTNDANSSWPSRLAARLLANPTTANLAIVNQGISGNRVLRENTATNALARFDRDVLSQTGVKWVMLMEGINDIGQGTRDGAAPENTLTVDDLIQGMKQLVDRAHLRGIKAVGCTLTPFAGAAYYSDKGEEMRTAYNTWIRTGGAFDAVVDFDKAVQDPANPKQIKAEFNIMDHLHPNDAGYKAMADSINLSIFTGQNFTGQKK